LVLDDNRRSSGRLKHRPSARPRGIRVNAVAPGVIVTDMSNFTKTEADRASVMGMQSLKCIGEPDDVASVVEFLASDAHRTGSPATSSQSTAAQNYRVVGSFNR
jgi:NAD(P)-dependent dehydrogenase (short-subunit alcohol dehydrogenase family)